MKKDQLTPTEYSAIHYWLRKNFGRANVCENKPCKGSARYEWSLLKGKEYERKRENFRMLCKSCHVRYDFNEDFKTKVYSYRKGKLHKVYSSTVEAAADLKASAANIANCYNDKYKGMHTLKGFQLSDRPLEKHELAYSYPRKCERCGEVERGSSKPCAFYQKGKRYVRHKFPRLSPL